MTGARDHDLLVIGSGPAGKHAAIQAAKLGRRAAICERAGTVGGVCVNTGTIPSKTMREAVMYLSGRRLHDLYGHSYTPKNGVTMTDLLTRSDHVVRSEVDVTRAQIIRNDVEILIGEAGFEDPHSVRVEEPGGRGERHVSADHVVIAVGTSSARDTAVPFDGRHVMTSEDILELDRLPRTLAVVGAGVIGTEYAGIFAALGVRLTPWLGEEVTGVELLAAERGDAVGNVIGFPSLASTSMEQGRLAALHAFRLPGATARPCSASRARSTPSWTPSSTTRRRPSVYKTAAFDGINRLAG